ncbi:hypothetical protein ACFPYI_03930 [Halomarina salina]|uniref:Uncharacterized protein n=1 Tax=Halomarina salina TaxID=1872699 RepID=A0ABD5RJE0_9EURY|nr:hypothetical protein [Halomarina salina]
MATQSELLSVLVLSQFVFWGVVGLILDFEAALPVLPLVLLFGFALYAYLS